MFLIGIPSSLPSLIFQLHQSGPSPRPNVPTSAHPPMESSQLGLPDKRKYTEKIVNKSPPKTPPPHVDFRPTLLEDDLEDSGGGAPASVGPFIDPCITNTFDGLIRPSPRRRHVYGLNRHDGFRPRGPTSKQNNSKFIKKKPGVSVADLP